MLPHSAIIEAIETAPLNRGLRGADWLAVEGNVPVTFDNGDIVLFDNKRDGVYEIHVLFRGRGRKAIEHAKEAIRILFTEYRAKLIIGMVPAFRRDVKLLARWVGMRSAGLRPTINGACELFVLPVENWKRANA